MSKPDNNPFSSIPKNFANVPVEPPAKPEPKKTDQGQLSPDEIAVIEYFRHKSTPNGKKGGGKGKVGTVKPQPEPQVVKDTRELRRLEEENAQLKQENGNLEAEIAALKTELATAGEALAATEDELVTSKAELAASKDELATSKAELVAAKTELARKAEQELAAARRECEQLRGELAKVREELAAKPEPAPAPVLEVAAPVPTKGLLTLPAALEEAFPGEAREMVLAVLREARAAAAQSDRERRGEVLGRILQANRPTGELERRANALKQIFKDAGQRYDESTLAALADLGICLIDGKKHWKVEYAGVRIPLAKTPSDWRAALNTASDMANRCF